jgi:hypothetical protein
MGARTSKSLALNINSRIAAGSVSSQGMKRWENV